MKKLICLLLVLVTTSASAANFEIIGDIIFTDASFNEITFKNSALTFAATEGNTFIVDARGADSVHVSLFFDRSEAEKFKSNAAKALEWAQYAWDNAIAPTVTKSFDLISSKNNGTLNSGITLGNAGSVFEFSVMLKKGSRDAFFTLDKNQTRSILLNFGKADEAFSKVEKSKAAEALFK